MGAASGALEALKSVLEPVGPWCYRLGCMSLLDTTYAGPSYLPPVALGWGREGFRQSQVLLKPKQIFGALNSA